MKIIIKMLMKKYIRKQDVQIMDASYIDKKLSQYEKIVENFNVFYENTNLPKNESTFEMAREFIMNHEKMRLSNTLDSIRKDYLRYIVKGIKFAMSFVLGFIADYISKNAGIPIKWIVVAIIMILFLYVSLGPAVEGEFETKKLSMRLLEEITYEQYKALKERLEKQRNTISEG